MDENTIAASILLIVGGIQAIRPDLFLAFQAWIQRKIMGARYEPSQRTARVTRAVGVFVITLGILVLTGVIT